MRRRWRDTGHQARVEAPSDRASERLRRTMAREVADLRLQLEEASLRSDAYLRAGFPEEAAEVADEQRQLLARFHARLGQSVSEAAVEAEAERVLAAAEGADRLDHERCTGRERTDPRLVPALASAAVAAVLAVAALGLPVPTGGELSSVETGGGAPSSSDLSALPETAPQPTGPSEDRPDPMQSHATRAAATSSERSVADGAPSPAPDPSATERLVGFIDEIVTATEDAVRDALRALRDDGRDDEVVTAPAAPEPQVELSEEEPTEGGSLPQVGSELEPDEEQAEDG